MKIALGLNPKNSSSKIITKKQEHGVLKVVPSSNKDPVILWDDPQLAIKNCNNFFTSLRDRKTYRLENMKRLWIDGWMGCEGNCVDAVLAWLVC